MGIDILAIHTTIKFFYQVTLNLKHKPKIKIILKYKYY